MSRWNARSTSTRLDDQHTLGGRIGALVRRCGLAAPPARFSGVETLENRILLADDHPNFGQVFNTPTPAPVVNIVLNGSGVGSASGIIEVPQDNDLFRFTAPANDFVRVWADTINAESGNSLLDSHVQVWVRNPNTSGSLVGGGADNGLLSTGLFKDGWGGFIATAGQEYFIRVLSNKTSGTGATGDYVIRVNALTTSIALNPTTGEGAAVGNVTLPGIDVVYKITAGSGDVFDSLATAYATATDTDLDSRLDIYNANGVPISFDSDGGNLSNAFTAWRSGKDQTFYVRVRSDQLGNPATNPSTGTFSLVLDLGATTVTTDPVTRIANDSGSLGGAKDSRLYTFLAQGTGLSFVSIFPAGLPPISDSGLHLYDTTGTKIGFNELPGAASRLEIQLTGGQRYWMVVETFDLDAAGNFGIEVEAHHTFLPLQPTDDHASTPAFGSTPVFGTPEYEDVRRQFELATPMIWGAPEGAPDPLTPGATLPDHVDVVRSFGRGRIHGTTDTDLFQFVVPMDMLGDYPGKEDPAIMPPMPPMWLAEHRPSTRLQILVSANQLAFYNSRIRVFDSNFDLVYDTNNQVLIPFLDPSGMLDPASWPPELPIEIYGFTFAGDQPSGIEVWAGETYYLEISAESGNGTYAFEIQADAQEDTIMSMHEEEPGAAQWADAPEIPISSASGDGRTFYDTAGTTNLIGPIFGTYFVTTGNLNGINTRCYESFTGSCASTTSGTPGAGPDGLVIFQAGDLGRIQTIDDIDLYQFRATYTGTAEIRINSTNLADSFWEAIVSEEDGDPMTPPDVTITTKSKTYSSPLQSALRIFDNDFNQIGFTNGNTALDGEFGTFDTGTFAGRRFYERDGRIVINVVAGNTYFVQVESGQLEAFQNGDGSDVDWRRATGSYELLVNAMPNLNFIDDHANNGTGAANATVIPINQTLGSAGIGTGTLNGSITNNAQFNPVDTDLFKFIAPASGVGTVTVTPTGGSLSPSIQIIRAGNTIGQSAQVGVGQPATVDFAVTKGDVIQVVVSGRNASQGAYRLDLTGLPYTDDYASVPDWYNAHEIPLNDYDYDGIETRLGSIETAGDTDVFKFIPTTYDTARITVTAVGQFDPFVEVYEVGEDGNGNPLLQRVAFNDDINFPSNLNAQVLVSTTSPDRISGVSGGTFNYYYIVVSGFDPETTSGNYELKLEVTRTDDHPDTGQFAVARNIPLSAPTGLGSATGIIEKIGDTDLFRFTAGAQGTATITVTSPSTSMLRQGVRVFDNNFNAVTDLISGNTLVLGLDSPNSTATFRFTASRNTVYYVAVQGGPLNPGYVNKTQAFGAYSVGVTSPVLDDHANQTEFPFATLVPLSIVSGDGFRTGILEINTDTDLFKTVTIADGDLQFTIDTPSSFFTPVMRLFRGDTSEIGSAVVDGGPGDEDGQVNGSVTRTVAGTVIGETYFVLVSSDPGGFTPTGAYTLSLFGNEPPRDPEDDHADAGEFDEATAIPLSTFTGDGKGTGGIQFSGDTDLFTFTSLGRGRAYVQVVTPTGQAMDVRVTIFGPQQGIVTSDSIGLPGVNAYATFIINDANQPYWILVEPIGSDTGDYTVLVDTAPSTHFLYYPEGFASRTIREFIALENPNDFSVTYTIRLRYEDPALADVIVVQNASINPLTRDGVTVSDGRSSPLHGITFGKPYAIIIESSGPLGASLSHYDFDASLGENFTDRTSTLWTFARGERFPGGVRDFLLFYNPNSTAAVVTLTAYGEDGSTTVLTQTVLGQRRGGWAFNKVASLPIGAFSFTVTSAPLNGSDPHIGIVAALSHYDLVNQSGDAVLGDPDGGSTVGVIPGTVSGGGTSATYTFFNNSNAAATVTIRGTYINTGIPGFTRDIVIGARTGVTFTGPQLGLVDSQVAGLRYDADARITLLARTTEFGDGTGTQAGTNAALGWFFGDAFINTVRAGTQYFENLSFYNPTSSAVNVNIRILFTTGETTTTTVALGADSFGRLALHAFDPILSRGGNQFFAIEVTAAKPIVASLNHFDLFLAGGWSTNGSALGIVTPVASIG